MQCDIGLREDHGNAAHLAKQVMIIREHALGRFESECVMKVLELQELRTLAVSQKTQILEDRECITRDKTRRLGGSIWKSNRLKLVGVEQTAIFLDDLFN